MKKYLYKTFLFLIPAIFIFAKSEAKIFDADILNSDDQGIHFVLNVSESDIQKIYTTDSSLLYYISLPLALPAGKKAVVENLSFVNLATIDTEDSNKTYSNNISYEISEPDYHHSVYSSILTIYPKVGNQFANKIEITVRFDNSTTNLKPRTNKLDRIDRNLFVNPDIIKSNRIERASFKVNAVAPFADNLQWLKIKVSETGIYRIYGSDLISAGIVSSSFDSDDLHLYNGGGKPLSALNEDPRPEFTEIAIQVEDGGDGTFDSDDYLLFYGEALNRFVSNGTDFIYSNFPYDDENVYWLVPDNRFSGKRMDVKDVSLASVDNTYDTTISKYTRYSHLEQNNLLRMLASGKIDDYYTWYWSSDDSVILSTYLNNYQNNDSVKVTIKGKTLDTTGSLDNVGYFDLTINGSLVLDKSCNLDSCIFYTTSMNSGSNNIKINQMYNSSSEPYMDYIEFVYPSANIPESDQLDMTIGFEEAVARLYIADNFSGSFNIYNISDPFAPELLDNFERAGGTIYLYDSLKSSEFNRYLAVGDNKIKSVNSIELVTTNNLYSLTPNVDQIVIAPEFLHSALSDYISYRTLTNVTSKLVSVSDIMDNFSYGLYDPVAIRDYLKYYYENSGSSKPTAALLVGDGSYDFLNILGTGLPNYVPPFIHPYDNSSSDDNYVYFGKYGFLDSDTTYLNYGDHGWDMIISRWPIRSSEEVATITDKIRSYETAQNLGIWRNRVTLVADDEYGTYDNEDFHTIQTEQLSNYHIPNFVSRDKIYLWDYPFVNGLKPAANTALVNSINNGSLVVNYVGHGNPDVWAHESIFNRVDDLPKLTNGDKLSLFFAASCAIGFFDDPQREGMAEDLLTLNDGGAVGVISATRLVYSSDNAAFNRLVFDLLFSDNNFSICEAVYSAKLIRQYVGTIPVLQRNDRNYLLFSDPFLKLGVPKNKVTFNTTIDSLTALTPITVTGQIEDTSGALISNDGVLTVNVYDSNREKTYRLVNSSGAVTSSVSYSVNGPVIFRGDATVTNGEFEFTFIPPVDIGFGGTSAKIMAYAALGNLDAAGIEDSISVSNSVGSTTDSTGPEIQLLVNNQRELVSGDYVNPDDELSLILNDLSGINLAGGLGHGITMEVDNQTDKMQNLTSNFEYNQDDFTSGSLTFNLDNLEPGSHDFKIKAWDNANNYSVYEFTANIVTTGDLKIVDLLNYPNPMNDSTTFSYTLTQDVEKFTLEIFTLSGRKINSFVRHSLAPSYYDDIIWYGQDAEGYRVATEVYLYKATAYPTNGGDRVEEFGKIILVN